MYFRILENFAAKSIKTLYYPTGAQQVQLELL